MVFGQHHQTAWIIGWYEPGAILTVLDRRKNESTIENPNSVSGPKILGLTESLGAELMADQTNQWMLGAKSAPIINDFSEKIAYDDHKIRFAVNHCRKKEVLDLGCVHHNPKNYNSRFWLHKALAEVSKTLEGLDLYQEGVEYLQKLGYQMVVGSAENFELGKKYDVIVAGDLIEHLGDLSGFLSSCHSHLRPGGKLLISTPNPWYWRNVLKALLFGKVSNNPEHTLWMCPVTLGQLVCRYDLQLVQWHFGSRYLRDRLMPLPKGLKHTSFHAVIEHAQ